MITHNESISIADYFTLRENGKVVYRPTCHYAYHPCDDAVLSLHDGGRAVEAAADLAHPSEDDIVDGIDELGVLLCGHAKNAYWYGSQLSIEETRRLAPYQNATGLQVTSAVLAGIVWMLENPERGIVEAMKWISVAASTCSGLISVRDRLLYRLDTARRPQRTLSRDARHQRSLAIQQRAGELAHPQSGCQQQPCARQIAGLCPPSILFVK
jgi:Homospermidine synthase